MTPLRLAYLLLADTAMALGVLFAVLGTGEYLIPGFASPFIDMVHLGLFVLALCALVALLRPADMEPPGLSTRIWQGSLTLCALFVGGVLLWANTATGSLSDMALLGAYALVSVAFVASGFTSR